MKILLSPAKSLNDNVSISNHHFTIPNLMDCSTELMSYLKEMQPDDIKKLMGISDQIAELNYDRFQSWNTPFNIDNSSPCGWVFAGAAYKGLEYSSLNNDVQQYSQGVLRILSGLYGVLRPFDLIQPYRLEMGTKLSLKGHKNLYSFWKKLVSLLYAQAC